MNRPSPAAVFVIVAAAAVPFLDLGGGAPAGGASAVGAATTSVSVDSAGSVASLPTASTFAPAIVTIVGTINRLLPGGALVVNDGQTDYTVEMSATTKVRNLRGNEVTRDFIRLGAQIQVSGTLTGSRILDPTILIPTVLDKP